MKITGDAETALLTNHESHSVYCTVMTHYTVATPLLEQCTAQKQIENQQPTKKLNNWFTSIWVKLHRGGEETL